VAIATGAPKALVFAAAMLAGMALFELSRPRARKHAAGAIA